MQVKTIVPATVPQVLRYFNEQVVCMLINVVHGTITSTSTCLQFYYFKQKKILNMIKIIGTIYFFFSKTFVSPLIFLLTAISQNEKKDSLK